MNYPELQWPLPCFVQSRVTKNVYYLKEWEVLSGVHRPLICRGWVIVYGPGQGVFKYGGHAGNEKAPCPKKSSSRIPSGRFTLIEKPSEDLRHIVQVGKLMGVIHG